MSQAGSRHYTLEAGDELTLHTGSGALSLLKSNGIGYVNLNEFLMGVTRGNHREVLKAYDAAQFAVLCEVVASFHGLKCGDVRSEHGVTYVCPIDSINGR